MNLRAGALPAAIEVAQELIVEASLGADSIQHGMQAAAVGLVAVVLAMLIYYRWAGANATVALVLSGVFSIGMLRCSAYAARNRRRRANRRNGGRQQCLDL